MVRKGCPSNGCALLWKAVLACIPEAEEHMQDLEMHWMNPAHSSIELGIAYKHEHIQEFLRIELFVEKSE